MCVPIYIMNSAVISALKNAKRWSLRWSEEMMPVPEREGQSSCFRGTYSARHMLTIHARLSSRIEVRERKNVREEWSTFQVPWAVFAARLPITIQHYMYVSVCLQFGKHFFYVPGPGTESPPHGTPPPPNLGRRTSLRPSFFFPSFLLLSLLPFFFPSFLSLFPPSFLLSSFPPSFEAMSAAHHHHRGRRCLATRL